MEKNNVETVIDAIEDCGVQIVRKSTSFTWGDKKTCRALFEKIFREVDKTIQEFEFLPEYDAIVNWMVDTKGKGLCLWGSCGRGKSVIIEGVVPVLLHMKGKLIKSVPAKEMRHKCIPHWQCEKPDEDVINLDYLLFSPYPIIDEIGGEQLIVEYGNRINGVSLVVEVAEKKVKPVFVSTNLTPQEMMVKYGVSILDRFRRLCQIVEFNGKSKRAI